MLLVKKCSLQCAGGDAIGTKKLENSRLKSKAIMQQNASSVSAQCTTLLALNYLGELLPV